MSFRSVVPKVLEVMEYLSIRGLYGYLDLARLPEGIGKADGSIDSKGEELHGVEMTIGISCKRVKVVDKDDYRELAAGVPMDLPNVKNRLLRKATGASAPFQKDVVDYLNGLTPAEQTIPLDSAQELVGFFWRAGLQYRLKVTVDSAAFTEKAQSKIIKDEKRSERNISTACKVASVYADITLAHAGNDSAIASAVSSRIDSAVKAKREKGVVIRKSENA